MGKNIKTRSGHLMICRWTTPSPPQEKKGGGKKKKEDCGETKYVWFLKNCGERKLLNLWSRERKNVIK